MSQTDSLISRRGFEYGVIHLKSSFNSSLMDVVEKLVGLSATDTQELLWLGAVYLNQVRTVDGLQVVREGDTLRVHTRPRRFSVDRVRYPEIVVFENNDCLIVNKPSGIPIHANVDNLRENLIQVLSEQMRVSLKITHRLDSGTQGLVVFAKTSAFQKSFNSDLRYGRVEKWYRAVVHGEHVPLGRWVHYMEPSPRAPKNVAIQAYPGWSECVLHILSSSLKSSGVSEVIVRLETGRTHQIRAQLAAIGHPLVGDSLYENATIRQNPQNEFGFFLQSYKLKLSDGTVYEL